MTTTQTGQRILDFDGTWFRGTKSDLDPSELPVGYSFMTVNMLNIGGTLSCRPGHRCIVTFPEGRLQGAAIFRPNLGLEQMLCCIDGKVYVSVFPFVSWALIPNILLSSTAKQVFWVQTVQAARRINTDFASAIEVIDPRQVMFIQDGGITAPAWWDGSNSGHVRNNLFETPSGSSMAWVGDRLWVANGHNVYASDIANPFSFREQIYLGGIAAFNFSRDVTAMIPTSSLDFAQLLVWTDSDASILQANIRDRSQWPTTDGMQTELFKIGCVSQRSAVSHQGRISWFSPYGFSFFDASTAGRHTSRIPIRDNEMKVSKSRIGGDLSLIAGGAFGQYILMSVPADDLFNKHTWVFNDASLETLSDDSGPSWSGYWTGTRPVEWMHGVIAGEERIYHVSTDDDGQNRLWESFTPDRLDNGCPIAWSVETRAFFGLTSPVREKNPGANCRMGWADIHLCGMEEDIDLGVFYAGGLRGAFKQILSKKLSVQKGSLSYKSEITATTPIFAFKAQSRMVRTQDANNQSTDQETGSCPAESPNLENIDESFQLLIAGHGPATIHRIRAFGFTITEDISGDSQACEDEKGSNAVRFDGAGAHSDDSEAANLAALSASPIPIFTSVQTTTVEVGNFSAVGSGYAESIVSQRAADRVALRIAVRKAEAELAHVLPPSYSIGEA